MWAIEYIPRIHDPVLVKRFYTMEETNEYMDRLRAERPDVADYHVVKHLDNVNSWSFVRDANQDIWRTRIPVDPYCMMIGWEKFSGNYIITVTDKDNRFHNIDGVNPGDMVTWGLSERECNRRIENMYKWVDEHVDN